MRQPLAQPADWLDLLRWGCLVVSRTPPEVIRSLSLTAPCQGHGSHILPHLCHLLAQEYCLRVTVEVAGGAWHIAIARAQQSCRIRE